MTIENTGMNIENTGTAIENVGMTTKNMGTAVENLGMTIENVGMTSENTRPTLAPHPPHHPITPSPHHPYTPRAGMWLMARSASAVMVRLGFTPTLAGMAEPSTTYRPG